MILADIPVMSRIARLSALVTPDDVASTLLALDDAVMAGRALGTERAGIKAFDRGLSVLVHVVADRGRCGASMLQARAAQGMGCELGGADAEPAGRAVEPAVCVGGFASLVPSP